MAETWKSAAKHAAWAVAVYALFRKYPLIRSWLQGFERVWGELLAVTTFTLTFFVNEAYSCWRKCLDTCYIVQGRLNDLSMVRERRERERNILSYYDDDDDDDERAFIMSCILFIESVMMEMTQK